MISDCPVKQSILRSLSEWYTYNDDGLTLHELVEIAGYTIQKINNYPKSFGKTVENYFHLLFPDEIKSYVMGQTINERTLRIITKGAN